MQALPAILQQIQSDVSKGFQELNARLDSRTEVVELDAGMAELRAAYARTNRRIDQLFYTLVGIGGALLVGMAAILIRSFL